jgi:energy-coupling factor transporter ATP-binding protein EcfA2
MSIADGILAFSQTRPDWQQDVIRRLFAQAEFSDSDFRSALAMLKTQYGLPQETAPTPIPFSAADFPQQSPGAPPVILNSLGHLLNTNRLATGQVLNFGISGLTVIYGDNGSGKSGYCRILKKLCHVREGGEEDVRGNAFDPSSVGTRPEATVRFTVGTTEPTEVRWKDGDGRPPEALSRVSVFDAKTVSLYADQQNRIEFLPAGLDVMTRLGGVCEKLSHVLDAERTKLEERIAIPLPSVPTDTEASALISRLVKSTLPQDLPTKAVLEATCAWLDEDALALQEAERRLVEDPEAQARKLRNIVQSLDNIQQTLDAATARVDRQAAEKCRRAWEEAKAAREAARLAAAQARAGDLLVGFGSNAWRLLFRYAKDYSELTYPNEPFPVTRDGARCVLCQQLLGQDAIARFKTFDEYVQGAAEAHAAHEERTRDDAKNAVERLMLGPRSDVEATIDSVIGEDPEANALKEQIVAYVDTLTLSRSAILTAFASGQWEQVPILPQDPAPELVAARTRLEAKAVSYDAMRSPLARKQLEEKVRDFRARKTLSASLPALLKRREDLDLLSRVVACKTDCDTTTISRKNTDLRKQYLTAGFESRLTDEIRHLELDHLPFKIHDRSDHGASYMGVGLETAVRVRNKEILSDGEFRALAIGCFLAEVNGIANHNGIIIDDPVSSLDCQRTRRVARRLTAEARKGLQVIVFTHDLVFYHELRLAAAEENVPIVCHWIRRTPELGFGTVFNNEEPWQAKNVRERLGGLEHKLAVLRKVLPSAGDIYRDKVKDFYSDLRETWERLVEELLLNDVVGRFQRDVATKSLKGVLVSDEDYRLVFFGMKRASEYSGHDRPLAAGSNLPGHDEIAADLHKIRAYASELKERNRKLEKERKKLEEAPVGKTA